MPIENLTDRRLRGLKHEDGEIVDIKTGLIARADRAGVVTFSFRYRLAGSASARRRFILGRYPGMPLVEARKAVDRLRETIRAGADPQAERRKARDPAQAGLSFGALCDLYVERYARPSKASWRDDVGFLRHARRVWDSREAVSITRQDVARLLFDVVRHAPVAANRLRSVLSRMYNRATDNALFDIANPVAGTKKPHREGQGRSRVLNDGEIRVLWPALDDMTRIMPATAAALRVVLLTAVRPGEASGMAVAELHDLDDPHAALWVISAHRMKARKSHAVPLVGLAREIVAAEIARQAAPEFVFASKYAARRRLARNSLSEALARLIDDLDESGIDAKIVAQLKADKPRPHDLRRSAVSGMAKLGISRDTTMAVAAHTHNDPHAIYRRYDYLREKRVALEAWERHLRAVIAGEPTDGAEIVTLRHAKGAP